MIRLKGENMTFFETQVNINQTTQHYIPENTTFSDSTPRTSSLARHTQVYRTQISERNLVQRVESGKANIYRNVVE